LGATQRRPNGELVPSHDLVLVVVPERGTDIAGRATDRADQPLVMLVPRDGGPATVVVQAPEPDAPLDGAEVAVAEPAEPGRTGTLFSRPSSPDAENPVRTTETGPASADGPEVALAGPADAPASPFAA